MVDRVSKATRSTIMASVSTHDTGPEIILRKALHALGFRYRTNYAALPGKPDIVFPKLRKVIFVHGCFWHGHACRWGRLPKSRLHYWAPKIAANHARDVRVLRLIKGEGWKALVVWQCQIRNLDKALPRVLKFLGDFSPRIEG
jgi:DNA mismatch endonuclease (patch repair protein)